MIKDLKQKLILIIPAYNEAKRLQKSLDFLDNFFIDKQYLYKICMVDDGSVDNTSQLLKKYQKNSSLEIEIIFNNRNLGKGASIKKALKKYSNFEGMIAFTDADLPYGLEPLEKAKELIVSGKTDLLIGNRGLQGNARSQYSFYRYFFKKIFNMALPKRLRKYKDTQSGIKMFNHKITRVFDMVVSDGWCFDLEILLIADNNSLLVKEIPVSLRENPSSGGVSLLRHGFGVAIDLIKIKLRDEKGCYKIKN